MTILTIACRVTNEHEDCAGHIYLGSIFGKPTACQCSCHPTRAVCPSTIHKTPREGTVPGTFDNPYSDTPPKHVTYCAICAEAIEGVGMFTPDPSIEKIEPAATPQ